MRFAATALMAIGVLSVTAPSDAAGSSHRPGKAKTVLYVGKKRAGELVQETSRLYDVVTLSGEAVGSVSVLRNGAVLVSDSLTPFANGYARPRPGRTWNVNAYSKGKIKSFGTVRRRDEDMWVAYFGIGDKARRVGYATGPHADLGAVAVLLVSCICD